MGVKAVLVDDDALVRKLWDLAAKQAGLELLPLADGASLRAALPTLPFDIPLYIDASLANGESGEALSKQAAELGFRAVYLATGLPAEEFRHCVWLSGVIGKDPPW